MGPGFYFLVSLDIFTAQAQLVHRLGAFLFPIVLRIIQLLLFVWTQSQKCHHIQHYTWLCRHFSYAVLILHIAGCAVGHPGILLDKGGKRYRMFSHLERFPFKHHTELETTNLIQTPFALLDFESWWRKVPSDFWYWLFGKDMAIFEFVTKFAKRNRSKIMYSIIF